MSPSPLTAQSVRAARERIAGHIIVTPTVFSQALSQATGAHVYLKLENLQHTGAFKVRGALAKITTLNDAQKKAGVIAMSAGNHAQGVAYHAGRLGIPATIVMPKGTPFMKIRKTRDYGATVLLEGESLVEASAFAEKLATERGITFIHLYNDPDVIAGQGTIGFEMLDAVPELDTIVVPIGGGGMIAGIALAAKAVKPTIDIIGVEPELYPSMSNAVQGRKLPCGGSTMAEGIAVVTAGAVSAPIVRAHVRSVVTVSETSIERAVAMLATRGKTVTEGAGAAPLAALLEYRDMFEGKTVGLVISGANVDARMLSSVLMRDLVREKKVLTLNIEMPDKPGQLHAVSGICAEEGANVMEVIHSRFAMDLSASSARLGITLETRDEDHAKQVMDRIRMSGFKLSIRDPNEP
ncbi:MAG: threonine ammonia-lyase [Alphaproteobacteria bacterium]|nr:threonine ammonia-lyase [Alphaproteobacteria bacterium]PHY01095.1 MAG: threonine ammonia-lyase [Rhodospirillaceae bacterium]